MKNLQTDHSIRNRSTANLIYDQLELKHFASLRLNRLVLSLTALLFCSVAWGQAPEKISYQSVVRTMANTVVSEQAVGVQITILQGSSSGANIYRERHSVSTNIDGLLSLDIGDGVVQNGSFSAINWSAGPYFVMQEVDPAGGTSYTLSQTKELLSVPYALFAQTAAQANSAGIADVAASFSGTGNQGHHLV